MSSSEIEDIEPNNPTGMTVSGMPGIRQRSCQPPPLVTVVDMIASEISRHPADKIFAVLTERLSQVRSLSFAGVWLIDPDGGTLLRNAWSGRSPLITLKEGDVNLGQSMIGRVLLSDRPLQIEVVRAAPEILVDWGNSPERITAFLGVPLVRGANRLGVLCLLSSRWLNEEEVTLLSLLARQAAIEAIAKGLETSQSPEDGGSQTEPAAGALEGLTARVTHELRSPLTSLRGNVQLAMRAVERGDPHRAGMRLRAALDSADALARLLENVQDMSLLEQRKLMLSPSPADLTAIVSSAVRRVEGEADAEHHVLRVVAPNRLLGVYDISRLEQCLFNLITNAVKYSPAGRVIRVQVDREGDQARVLIIDEGAGIPEEEQERIFEPYYRGAIIDRVDARGLGLGLSISLAIAEGHGGRIDVRSEPGRGSTFIVRLPLAPPGVAGP